MVLHMFDKSSPAPLPAINDQTPSPPAPRPGGDRPGAAYVTAAVAGYGTALGEIVALLGPESVPASRRPELWDALDRLERLASTGKMMLSAPAA